MTSISSFNPSQTNSPLTRLQAELTSEVSAGTISSGDKDALSSALSDIDSALRGQRTQGGPPPSPDQMQSKINDLISSEVDSGKLTSDQANELKGVFAKAFQGGPGGPGGAAPARPSDSSGGVSGSNSTGDSSSSDDVSQLINDFLKLLQDSQGSSNSYAASGANSNSKIQSLVVDTAA